MKQKIEKFILFNTSYTRSQVKKMIRNKEISVNNKIIFSSCLIDITKDIVTINNQQIIIKDKFVYFALNKPSDYVCANIDNLHKTVFDLLLEKDLKYKNLHTVGRLDKDTEGLLIITNDGEFTHLVTSPKKHIKKIYYVKTDNKINYELINIFAKGIDIGEKHLTKPSELVIKSNNEALLTIYEGKFHQVKRMFAKFGLKVDYLKRIQFGNLLLPDIKLGEYIRIFKEDIIKNT
ncbi:pseudouridine synthase [Mycoplasma leonicaptivi]|uniref:pseudouridine synthase n=1 Tax=Mycoplasma leonicaptivi TaxID=36742 RepID=UPI000484C8AB|nr:pseudouridine synthase [Mycoplasma leonicaptivi]